MQDLQRQPQGPIFAAFRLGQKMRQQDTGLIDAKLRLAAIGLPYWLHFGERVARPIALPTHQAKNART